ncbi:hypothetical protein [Nitrosopumilus sp.]|uniref:hypothetical protein n=1 Tax=Nitrosopumilus sp. TaxID=2024843 RepID=UPI003B5CDCFC
MIKNNKSKIFLLLFSVLLINIDQVYGMFNQQGQWVCSNEIDIELSYYQTYTENFQTTIDKITLSDGAAAAQSYFESAIKEEKIGQDWQRSLDCVTKLGIDDSIIPTIVISEEELPPKEENFRQQTTDDLYYVGVVIMIAITIIGFTYFYLKSNKNKNSKYHEKNDESRKENSENIEIEIRGGIEK